jgi:hypothetical protein
MSTIDDFACAKLAAAGCENPKAVLLELKLFGFPEKDLSRYLRAAAWELEEAVALGLGRHLRNLSLAVIREKCPEQIDLQGKDWHEDQLPSAQLFMDRYGLLKRAAFIGDIKSEERDGTLWFKPVDLATYACKEWGYMPSSARALMASTGPDVNTEKEEAARATDEATAPAVATEAGAAAFAPTSANTPAGGAAEPQEGDSFSLNLERLCRDYLIDEMGKSLDRNPKTRGEYLTDCKKRFKGLGSREFRRAWKSAIEVTRSAW